MPDAHEQTEYGGCCVNSVKHIEELSLIKRPNCAAVILERPVLPIWQSWLDELDPLNLPNARFIAGPEAVREMLEEICEESETPECRERQSLIDDIARLAEVFAKLMKAPYLRVRLDIVTTNACKKFHVDYLTARMVCTYRGPGTEYGASKSGCEPQAVSTVATADPLLMRGKQWPNNPVSNVLHRSPQIEGSGVTRLVLVLDPVQEMREDDNLLC